MKTILNAGNAQHCSALLLDVNPVNLLKKFWTNILNNQDCKTKSMSVNCVNVLVPWIPLKKKAT